MWILATGSVAKVLLSPTMREKTGQNGGLLQLEVRVMIGER